MRARTRALAALAVPAHMLARTLDVAGTSEVQTPCPGLLLVTERDLDALQLRLRCVYTGM
eukprot:1158306-Pelagomonas_calceolata.AAC.2